jgi:quercetin dioxygenase-like cupin family protein
MKPLTTAFFMALAAAAPVTAQSGLAPVAERQSNLGPSENFTGTVTVTSLFEATEQSNATGSLVEFTPGARSAWHTHPAGQTLIVTSGIGWTQIEGEEKAIIRAGDVVNCPPDLRHWHGATATTSMSHIAITPVHPDRGMTWLELVSDEDYAN